MPPIHLSPQPSVVRVNPPLPADHALRGVLDDVLAQLKYSFTAHASGESTGAPGELDQAMAEFLASRTSVARERYRGQARAALAAPLPQRTAAIGRYAGIPIADYRKLGSEQLRSRVAAPTIDPKQLTDALAALRRDLTKLPSSGGLVLKPPTDKPGPKFVLGPGAADLIEGLKFRKMRLLLNSVHCFEETDGLLEGSDEISLGGTVTSAKGKSAIVSQFKVSEDFDEGETKQLGGKAFATWNIVTDNDWPHVYGAVIAMAEKDDGGFYKFIKKLWEQVEAKVKAAVTALVGAGIGAAIGTAFGGIIGTLAGLVIGILIGWIISLFENPDDILGVGVLVLTLTSAKKSYYDWAKLTSKNSYPVEIHYKGEGGHYRLRAAYKVAPA